MIGSSLITENSTLMTNSYKGKSIGQSFVKEALSILVAIRKCGVIIAGSEDI
jgi:hypothetical protein